MTTATVQAPVTEAEIRAHVERALDTIDLGESIHEAVHLISWSTPGTRGPSYWANGGPIWDDLRSSEAERLSELIEPIYGLADAMARQIVERVIQAAVQFASEYPDAPLCLRPGGARAVAS